MTRSVEDMLIVRMETTLRQFERQMEAARKAANTSATGSQKSWDVAGKHIAANANRATTGLQRMINVSRGGRFVLQNTANQIGDMAVQFEMGTNASRIMSQQLPQLFGGFGALGGTLGLVAPLLGTVAALGIPVAAALLRTGEEAQTTEERLKGLKDAIADLQKAQTLSAQSPLDLLDQYGGLADEARKIFEINRQIAAARAQSALRAMTETLASDIGVGDILGIDPDLIRQAANETDALTDRLVDLANQRDAMSEADPMFASIAEEVAQIETALGTVKNELGELTAAFELGDEEANQFAVLLARIGEADGPREQAKAMSELAEFIYEVTDGLKSVSPKAKLFYEQLNQATMQMLELAKETLKSDIAGEIGTWADEAERLADNLERARGALLDDITGNPDFFDPRNESGTSGRIIEERGVPAQNRPGYKPPNQRKASSGLPDGMRDAQRMYRDTRTEAEKYEAELERINELHRQFPQVITEEVRDRAIKALEESVSKLGDMTRNLERNFESAFVNFVSGASSARDAVRALTQDLLRLAARSAFQGLSDAGLFDDLFGAILPNAKGNAFVNGTPVTAFAQGGIVDSPTFFGMRGSRTGLMGEAGPEAIMPLTRTAGGKLGVTATGAGNVTVPISVEVINNANNARVETRRSDDGRSLQIAVLDIVKDGIMSGKLTRPMQQQFGLRDRGF